MAFALITGICGCGKEEKQPLQTLPAPQTTAPETGNYSLTRSWTAEELKESIYFCGKYHSFPLIPEKEAEFSLSDGVLTFPDGTFAYAGTDESGSIVSLRFERESAPDDASVLGIGFNSVPEDIPQKVGIAEAIYGDKDDVITYSFYGGGITELTFVYKERALQSFYISN